MDQIRKLALITLHHVKNYGSVLQTYATQYYFEKMSLKVQVIDYRRKWETGYGYWFYLQDRSIIGVLRQIMYFPSKFKQKKIFDKFLSENINLTNTQYKTEKDFISKPIYADIYCTGSDQVWNSGWNNGIISEYYLSFVKKQNGEKKISFAASFGQEKISVEEANIIENNLRDYDLITVRETKAKNILKDQLGLDSTVILDPTLQIPAEHWRELAKDQYNRETDYVLLIQLNRNKEFDTFSVRFAQDKGKKLVRLCLRIDQLILPGKHVVLPEVKRYISLIDQASYILTDSFHAISFCINLNKQFYCWYPNHYSSRLSSIIELLSLQDRVIDDENLSKKQQSDINYNTINEYIIKQREQTIDLFTRYIV